jgi:hypothetical protein
MKRDGGQYQTERFSLGPFTHAQVTETTSAKLFDASRPMQIDRVMYLNPTGLADHADNWFKVELQKGTSTVIATWHTDTGADEDIPADTPFDLNLVAAASKLAVGDVVKLVLTEGGAATLPAGHVVIEGRYL